ncbi:DUF4269 domain-containing protein [Sphingobium sp. Ant17]|uniref:DUF4269 domain-containing protein n=1 Tax=Sphingobium sp. Ant17 TaxID=1461752 RepID=UPI001F42D2D0|nr:DUF4269 domain-containing protein [Sphingobium sp. Ant17]
MSIKQKVAVAGRFGVFRRLNGDQKLPYTLAFLFMFGNMATRYPTTAEKRVSRPSYRAAIKDLSILTALSHYDPHVAGTLPLGLDVSTSDIDILCYAPDPNLFTSHVWAAFSSFHDFRIWQWCEGDQTVIAAFTAQGWQFELFGQAKPVKQQRGWRHFLVEQRLITLGGEGFVKAVMALRRDGMKTEPAFAVALDIQGDPYESLLDIGSLDEHALVGLLHEAGYR